MYFGSLQEIVSATDYFIRANGNPRAASDPQIQQQIALLAANFPSPADRNWLRLFVQSLQDESTKFFHAYWTGEQQARGAAYAAFQSAVDLALLSRSFRVFSTTRSKRPVSSCSRSRSGGEGRTVNDGKQSNLIAVEFPATIDAAPEALFGFVHEGSRQARSAKRSPTTRPPRNNGRVSRSGTRAMVRSAAARYSFSASLPSWCRRTCAFYLATVGQNAPSGDPSAAFAAAFSIPAAILSAINKQIDVVLGGI